MGLQVNKLQVGKLELSYLSNAPENPYCTVLFIHGFPFTKESWSDQLKALPNRLSGLALDVRGFGESGSGHGFFSIDLFASDLILVIKALGLKNVILGGLSMGGYIALRAIEKEPGLFAGLVLCDTNAYADSNEAKLNRFSSIERIQAEGKAAFAEGFIPKVLGRKTIERNAEVVARVRDMILSLPETTLCAAQLALASRTDTTHLLPEINIPTLIIRGEKDVLMTREVAEFLVSKIPNADFAEIPDSGHLPNIENPEEFNRVLNEFILNIPFDYN